METTNYTAPAPGTRPMVRCADCERPLVDALHREHVGTPLCEGCYVVRMFPLMPAAGLRDADCRGALSVPERRARCGHAHY